jgi:hypothetical protein
MPQLTYARFSGAILTAIVFVFFYFSSGCSKNPGLNHVKTDSTDTMRIPVHHDSAKFFASFDMDLANTSGIYADTFTDVADMIIYVVDGVVKVPTDSLFNWSPFVLPSSGSSGGWSATWIPDPIGEINVVGASGFIAPGDTNVVMAIDQSGTVSPKWAESFMGGTPFNTGGDPTPGWPLTFTFSTQQVSQFPFKLVGFGNNLTIWVYKDY